MRIGHEGDDALPVQVLRFSNVALDRQLSRVVTIRLMDDQRVPGKVLDGGICRERVVKLQFVLRAGSNAAGSAAFVSHLA